MRKELRDVNAFYQNNDIKRDGDVTVENVPYRDGGLTAFVAGIFMIITRLCNLSF